MDYSLDKVLAPLAAVIKDFSAYVPGLDQHADAEFERIRRLCETRGWKQVLMIELPKAGKHLDKCLSQGWLSYGGYPKTLGSIRKDTQLFNWLYAYLFDYHSPQGPAHTHSEVSTVSFLRQIFSLYKKVTMSCSQDAMDIAFQEFVDTDLELLPPILDWNNTQVPYFDECIHDFGNESWGYTYLRVQEVADAAISRFKEHYTERVGFISHTAQKALDLVVDVGNIIASEMGRVHAQDLLPRHGPGAVAEKRGGSYDKYDFTLWPAKLGFYLPYDYFGYHTEESAYHDSRVIDDSEAIGRLHAVPKTLEKPRLITIEPTAQQFLQQGLLQHIRSAIPDVLRTFIDFSDQGVSRRMALDASFTGHLATVDLSSASDRLSCLLVEACLGHNPSLLLYLYATRTTKVTFPQEQAGDYGGHTMELRKFAGMGSAVTFPVQSIVYAVVCLATAIACENPNARANKEWLRSFTGKIRVFGDDLIVPNDIVPVLDEVLSVLQLKINASKTHSTGHFRESCGMDAYKGRDVTPLYLSSVDEDKWHPKAICSWVAVRNNAYRGGLHNLVAYMDSCIPARMLKNIPLWHTDLGCLTRYCSQLDTKVERRRFNRHTQTMEVLGFVPVVKLKSAAREGDRELLRYFTEFDPSDSANYRNWMDAFKAYSSGYTVGLTLNLRRQWVQLR